MPHISWNCDFAVRFTNTFLQCIMKKDFEGFWKQFKESSQTSNNLNECVTGFVSHQTRTKIHSRLVVILRIKLATTSSVHNIRSYLCPCPGGLKLHQYHTQMASLKWKLRPSTSVNDALETSTASSSSLEDVSALTGMFNYLVIPFHTNQIQHNYTTFAMQSSA